MNFYQLLREEDQKALRDEFRTKLKIPQITEVKKKMRNEDQNLGYEVFKLQQGKIVLN